MSPVRLSPSPTPLPAPAPAVASSSSAALPPERPPRAALRVNTSSLHPSVTHSQSQQRLRSNSAAQTQTTPAHPSAHSFSRSLSHNVVASSPQATSPVSHGNAGPARNDVVLAVNGLRSTGPTGMRQVPNSPTSPGRPQRPTDDVEVDEQAMVRKVKEALERSADNGDTLDLSRRGIDCIGPEAVDVFRKGVGTDMKGVWRLALSYNALTDGSIVNSFSRLSRLRYLNLKGNMFTQFPSALSEMVSLEILDLSKNTIGSFPEEPGRLSQLKVLSLTNNQINALPSYLTAFNHLKVFKVDQNPIEWPPREILGSLMASGHDARSRKDEDLRPWIENMKNWMRQRRAEEDAFPPSEEEPISAVSTDAGDLYRLQGQDSSREDQLLSPVDRGPAAKMGGRHRAATVSALTSSSPQSPSPSALTTSSSNPSFAPSIAQPAPASGHTRGASFTATQRMSASLSSKKSLPDLRQSHAKIFQDRQQDQEEEARPPSSSRLLTPTVWQVGPRTPVTQQRSGRPVPDGGPEGPLADDSRNSYFRRMSMLPVSTISKAIPPELLQFVDAIRGILFALSQVHSALRQYLVFAVADRVAGIFTRVMDPATTYMNTLINALDRFDSISRRSTPPASVIKGVITATKETVAVFAKVVAVLRLQMPALRGGDVRYTRTLLLMIYGSMAEIGASWKAMSPLMAQVRPLLSDGLHAFKMAPTSSLSGRTPISPIPEKAERPTPHAGASSAPIPDPLASSVSMASPPSRARRQGGSFSTQDVERGMLMSSPGATGHASDASEEPALRHRPSGSVSQIVIEEDDEEGEEEEEEGEDEDEDLMPLPVPPFVKQHRSGSSSGLSAMYSEGSGPAQGSRSGHLATLSNGSLNGLSAANNPRKLSVDVRPPTPTSATLYDEDLLDVVETATEAGFTAWLKLAEDIGTSSVHFGHSKSNSQSSISSQNGRINGFDRPPSIPVHYHADLVRLLGQAEHITSALRESLAGIRANPLTWSQSSLSDNTQSFIKTVIKVSQLVKLISATHSFPQTVRQSLSRLTQATRECAILIQVSSLASTRAPSPAFSRGAAHPADSSTEDLTVAPHSAGWSGPPSSGLRGLQLATRHALKRPGGLGNGGPRSAQASQVAF